jgi:hypothetical protein
MLSENKTTSDAQNVPMPIGDEPMQNIELYYESLKEVYDRIQSWSERKPSFRERLNGWIVSITVVLLILSVVPIFPALIVFIGGQTGLVIGPIDLSIATFERFMTVWFVAVVVTGIILGLVLQTENKVDAAVEKRKKPPETLSPDQLTFLATYESYKELKIYFVSHFDRHIQNSLQALRRIASQRVLWRASSPTPRSSFIVGEEFDTNSREREFVYRDLHMRERFPGESLPSFAKQISLAQSFLNTFEKYAWFQLDATTKSELQALISFPQKVYYRLLKEEDLPTVLGILENLSKFIYAYLPEHQTNMDPKDLQKLQKDGRKALNSFVQQMNNLTPYRPVVEKEKPETVSYSFQRNLLRLYAYNEMFRFTLSLIISVLLISAIFYFLDQRMSLDVNVMVSTIITTSVGIAIALVNQTKKEEGLEFQDNESDTK